MQALPHIKTRFDRLAPFCRPAPYAMRVGPIAALVYLARRDFAEVGGEPYALIEAEVMAGLRNRADLDLAKVGRHGDHVDDLPECLRCTEWFHPVGWRDGVIVYATECAYCGARRRRPTPVGWHAVTPIPGGGFRMAEVAR